MTTVPVRLRDSLRQQLETCAKRDGISLEQLISSAVAEKLSAMMTTEYLESRGRLGNRKDFEAALLTVPDVEPDAGDCLPAKPTTSKRRANRRNN